MVSLDHVLDEYLRLGFDPLPLRSDSKLPTVKDWPNLSGNAMWRQAPLDANIGLRCGGPANLAVIDCDEKERPGTFLAIQDILNGLGLDFESYPTIQTASGNGRHIYVELTARLPGNYHNISSELGAGAFRYGHGAYVVAPPSIVDGNRYQLIEGHFARLPLLNPADFLEILLPCSRVTGERSRKPVISRHARKLLNLNDKGNYQSRSEAVQSILSSLANTGHDYESVYQLFVEYPATGKFKEMLDQNLQSAGRWLQLSFNNAQKWVASHESEARLTASKLLGLAKNRTWSGRSGPTDRDIYIVLVERAYKAGTLTVAVSVRDLASESGICRSTASNGIRRLQQKGFIQIQYQATAELANVYRIIDMTQTWTLPHKEEMRKCPSYAKHNAFRFGGLNKTAQMIYEYLTLPATIDQNAKHTQRSNETVKKYLKRMARIVDMITGEAINMVVETGDGKWQAVAVDLDRVAEILVIHGKYGMDRRKYERERINHCRWLNLNRQARSSDRRETSQ